MHLDGLAYYLATVSLYFYDYDFCSKKQYENIYL